MKKLTYILVFGLIALLMPSTVSAQSYSELWADADSLMHMDMPRQAEAAVMKIYRKAEAEGNAPWLMKAWIVRQHLQSQLDPETSSEMIHGIAEWLERETDVITRSILSSILGMEKALSEEYSLNDVLSSLYQSIEPAEKLYSTPAADYRPMTETGALSEKYLGDNLYDLLAREAIDALAHRPAHEEAYQLYSTLLERHKAHGNRSGAFLTEEAMLWYRIDEMSHIRKYALTEAQTEAKLEALAEEYADVDKEGDALMKLASWYYRRGDLVKTVETAGKGLNAVGKAAGEKFRSYIEAATRPQLEVHLPLLYPDTDVDVRVRFANLGGVTLELYAGEDTDPKAMQPDDAVSRKHFDLSARDDYQSADTVLVLHLPGQGVYTMRQIPDGHPGCAASTNLYISPYQCIGAPLDADRREFTVVDKLTGMPAADAEIVTYTRENKEYKECSVHPVDSGGRVTLPLDGRLMYRVRTAGGEAFMPVESVMPQRTFRTDTAEAAKELQALFTDRSVYRPGQTVHVSGLAYSKKGEEAWTREGVSLTVKLLQGIKRICSAEAVTDAMGVMTCDLTLPQDLRPGRYVVKTEGASAAIRVEEYKKPTFTVTFDECGDIYNVGDTLRMTARAVTFAGAPVRSAIVRYSCTRSQHSWFRLGGGNAEELMTGEAATDSEGRFSVEVVLEEPLYDLGRNAYLAYTLTADVTDVAGETQAASVTLPAGRQSLALRVTGLPEVVMREDEVTVQFEALNLKSMPVKQDISYKLMRDDEAVLTGEARTGVPFTLPGLRDLEVGRYTLALAQSELSTFNSQLSTTQSFILYSRDATAMPADTAIWFHQDGRTLYIGSALRDVYLMMNIYDAKGRIESRRVMLSQEVKKFTFDEREDLTATFAFVKQGIVYTKVARMLRPQPDRELQLRWTTFRDRLSPGQKEEWTLHITRAGGAPAAANLMATLYDASLDAIHPHKWTFALTADRHAPSITINTLRGSQSASFHSIFAYRHPSPGIDVISGDYSHLYTPVRYRLQGAMPILYRAASAAKATALDGGTASYGADEDESADMQPSDRYIRNRIGEGSTAFFLPKLRTDDDGNVTITFTAPPTLTAWRLLGFSHTRDMHYGMIEAAASTARQLMVQPSLPRYLRTGDKAQIVASLVNMLPAALKGKAAIELIDPQTEKTVERSSLNFEVKAGETQPLNFAFTVPDGYDMLIYRIVADAGEYGDGEQSVIPVLTNRETVVETIPFQIRGEETKTIPLGNLFVGGSKTAADHRLKIELTANPARQLLDALTGDSGDSQSPARADALSQASAYFIEKLKQAVATTIGRQPDPRGARSAMAHLEAMQLDDGTWAWYKGMDGNHYVTSQITELLARLISRGITLEAEAASMFDKAFDSLNREAQEAYRRAADGGGRLSPDSRLVHYAYICALSGRTDSICDSIAAILRGRSAELPIRQKAMTALIMQSVGRTDEAASLVASIKEYALTGEEMGVYFLTPRAEYSWRSYRLPTQVAAMEAITRISPDAGMLDGMKLWLLKQKQVQDWESSVATADAVYAFACLGGSSPALDGVMTADIDGCVMQTPRDSIGNISHEFAGRDALRERLTVTRRGSGVGWGAVYAWYEEDIDKVRPSEGHGLKIVRTYLTGGDLRVGDRVTVRLQITADRDMDFVEITDSRPSCLEPLDRLSGYRHTGALGYYLAIRDTSTGIYIDKLRRGTYTIGYEAVVDRAGEYSVGTATISSVYSPEYRAHDVSEGRMTVWDTK